MFKDSLCTDDSFNTKEERASVFSVFTRTHVFDGCFGSRIESHRRMHTVEVSLGFAQLSRAWSTAH